jgi:hypothetical protein
MSEQGFVVTEPAPGVHLYENERDGSFVVADHAGWVEGLFADATAALDASSPCSEACGWCNTEQLSKP